MKLLTTLLSATFIAGPVAQAAVSPEVERKIKAELLLTILPTMQRDFVKVNSITIEEKRSGNETHYSGSISFTTIKAAKSPDCMGYRMDFLENGNLNPEGSAEGWNCGQGERLPQ